MGIAVAWYGLGATEAELGEYEAAEEKLLRALPIEKLVGEKLGEAATWHNLAVIDMVRGERRSASQKFQTSLSINQEIGNNEDESQTFTQIGLMVKGDGRIEEGLRLVILGAAISVSFESPDRVRDVLAVGRLASELDYTRERFDAIFDVVVEAYRRDRSQSLIDAAFGDA